MRQVSIAAEREIDAPADRIYRILADYREHHPRILPPAFSGFTVEEGGVGAGTVILFQVTAGGRTTSYHQRVEEPEPGRMLREVDLDTDRTTTFTVTSRGEGCHVRIETTWRSRGARGLMERMVAPRLLRPVYEDELDRIDAYARKQETL